MKNKAGERSAEILAAIREIIVSLESRDLIRPNGSPIVIHSDNLYGLPELRIPLNVEDTVPWEEVLFTG